MLGNHKAKTNIEKLKKGIAELEHLDVDDELEKHEKLQNWEELNTKINNLKKEKHLQRSIKSKQPVDKVTKDIEELDNAVCYACIQSYRKIKKLKLKIKSQRT